jgi:hypothetical protein
MMEIMEQLSGPEIIKYLTIFNADIDWQPHLQELSRQISKRFPDENQAKEARRKQAACTIMLPYFDKTSLSDPPENLLFKCHTYHQFGSRDWTYELDRIVKKDHIIKANRDEALALGVIYPIEYNPNTRQAYRWLVEASQSSGDWAGDETGKKLKNLVYAYGGAVICNVFLKPEYKPKLQKLLNWRSGYFFEHLIYEVYKPMEILKVKNQELLKVKNSDPNLIKIVKTKETNVENVNDQAI